MSKKKKSWREKLADDKNLLKVTEIEGKMTTRWGEGTMVIPAPREVDASMKIVRKGKLTTIDELRGQLCEAHKTDIACLIATGIFRGFQRMPPMTMRRKANHASLPTDAHSKPRGS